jgi:hypothetical protein
MERIGPECVLDIGDEEFLVLLLMVEPEDNALAGCGRNISGGEILQRSVHVMAVGEDLVGGGAREGGAQLLLRLLGNGVVVAIEKPDEILMKRLIGANEFAQDEGFKEPGGVREVPLCGTCVWAGLHHHVFWRKRRTEGKTLPSHATKFLGEYC